jgi:hypothetical protein
MAFSYDETLPTALDRVRHTLGDVTSPGYRPNETIEALLATYPENQTVMILADSLASEFAMKPSNLSSPDGSITWGERVDQLTQLATRLRLEIEEGVVVAAQDKLRSFAPVREGTPLQQTEYYRPLYPIFFDRDGNYKWD